MNGKVSRGIEKCLVFIPSQIQCRKSSSALLLKTKAKSAVWVEFDIKEKTTNLY